MYRWNRSECNEDCERRRIIEIVVVFFESRVCSTSNGEGSECKALICSSLELAPQQTTNNKQYNNKMEKLETWKSTKPQIYTRSRNLLFEATATYSLRKPIRQLEYAILMEEGAKKPIHRKMRVKSFSNYYHSTRHKPIGTALKLEEKSITTPTLKKIMKKLRHSLFGYFTSHKQQILWKGGRDH